MKSNEAISDLLNRLTAMKKLLIASLFLSGTCVLNATDLTWAGGEVGNNSGFNFSDFGNWSPMGNTPSSFDNVTIGNFTATTDGSTDQYKINGFTQVNDLRIENLVLPKGVRFFIYTTSSDTPTINGNIYIGNIDLVEGGGGEWRSPDIRGGTFGMDFVVKGSITIAPTSTTTQNNSSVLTFGGTNTGGFFKSLSIGENAAVDASTGYKTAVYLDASYAGATLELAGANPAGDTSNWAVIHGVVKMNNSADGSKYASLLIGRNEEDGKFKDSYVSVGGLSGTGRISTKLISDASNAATSHLTFTNAEGVNTVFNGYIARTNKNYKDNVAFIMDGAGTQTLSLSGNTAGVVGVTVKNGTLYYNNESSSGKLVMEGGKFGAVNGSAEFDSALWSGGKISYANHEAFPGGTPEMIIINGEFEKASDGQIAIDFEGLDATGLIGDSFYLISADTTKGFLDDANDDFVAENLKNALADFAWNGGTLQVTFTQVPEPAALAAIIGAFALLFAIRRRRK